MTLQKTVPSNTTLIIFFSFNRFDFGDEVGRQALLPVMLQILKTSYLEETCIKVLIEIIERLIPNAEQRLNQISDLIRGIVDQNMNFNFSETNKIMDDYLSKSPNPELKTEFSKLRLQIMDLIEERDMARDSGNYAKTQDLQAEIDTHTEFYKKLIKPAFDSSFDDSVKSLGTSLYKRKRLSPETICKCLHTCFYMVASRNVAQLTPNVVDLYKKFVCIYIQSSEIGIRYFALRCATTYGLLYDTLAKEVFECLRNQFYKTASPKIWRISIECIFELLDYYGFEYFNVDAANNKDNKKGRTLYSNTLDDNEEEEISNNSNNSKDNLLGFMIHSLDKINEPPIIAVIITGLCRLMIHKHISSADIIAKFLLRYFNPATNDEILQILGIFFKNLIERQMQELLQQALFPTLIAIIDAPSESPLQDVDSGKLIRFVINSTKPEFCQIGLNIHNTIAMSFFSTIQDPEFESSKEVVKLFAGELHSLEISDDATLRTDLNKCVDDLVKANTDSKIVKQLIQFKDNLNNRRKARPEHSIQSEGDHSNDEEDDGEGIPDVDINNVHDDLEVNMVFFYLLFFI